MRASHFVETSDTFALPVIRVRGSGGGTDGRVSSGGRGAGRWRQATIALHLYLNDAGHPLARRLGESPQRSVGGCLVGWAAAGWVSGQVPGGGRGWHRAAPPRTNAGVVVDGRAGYRPRAYVASEGWIFAEGTHGRGDTSGRLRASTARPTWGSRASTRHRVKPGRVVVGGRGQLGVAGGVTVLSSLAKVSRQRGGTFGRPVGVGHLRQEAPLGGHTHVWHRGVVGDLSVACGVLWRGGCRALRVTWCDHNTVKAAHTISAGRGPPRRRLGVVPRRLVFVGWRAVCAASVVGCWRPGLR